MSTVCPVGSFTTSISTWMILPLWTVVRPSSSEWSDIAEHHRFAQRGQRIELRNEFVREVYGKTGVDGGPADGRPLQLLRVVELVSDRHAAGVIVRDVLVMLLDGADLVACHDLHVVDVVEQFHSRRIDGSYNLHAERRAV